MAEQETPEEKLPLTPEETTEVTEKETPAVEETPAEVIPAKTVVKAVVASKVKLQKVLGIENHQCAIGGKTYIVEKKKEYSFPSDVAAILAKGGVVIRK